MSSENPITPSQNENEAKEVSLLKQNLKYLGGLLLGKSQPPFLLKWLCYYFLVWDILLMVFYMLVGIGKTLFNIGNSDPNFQNYGYAFSLFHLISFIGVLLLWRKKLIGFYIFSIINLGMILLTFIISPIMTSLSITAIFYTVISIGLFALNWNKFDYVVRKKAREKELEKMA